MDTNDIKDELKSGWEKFLAAVKSAPATFAYGVAIGGVLGALFF